MIRFEFTLDDVDAENLISILNDEKCRALEKVTDCLAQGSKDHANWYKAHSTYLEHLKQKILAGQNSPIID